MGQKVGGSVRYDGMHFREKQVIDADEGGEDPIF
jgi:hypothetical protein